MNTKQDPISCFPKFGTQTRNYIKVKCFSFHFPNLWSSAECEGMYRFQCLKRKKETKKQKL